VLVEHVAADALIGFLPAVLPLVREGPIPTPSTSRPPLSRSRVTVCRATTTGRRRGSGVTSVPSRTRLVAVAAAVSVIHGSTTSIGPGENAKRWSQRKKPSQPASSASPAQRATRAASTPTPKFGRLSP
jgi:hypothetical protein